MIKGYGNKKPKGAGCNAVNTRENILHSALMRLPKTMTTAEKQRLVDAVIAVLDLTTKSGVLVGDLGGKSSLSGGQKSFHRNRTGHVSKCIATG